MEEKKVPALRFRGFDNAWEQRRLFECIDKIIDFRGRTPKKLGMDWSKEGYVALSALNVKDGYIDFTQDVHYGDQLLYDKWMRGNELHKGQVLFTTEAPMGNVAQIPDNRGYILSQRTIAFTANQFVIIENFLASVLRSGATQSDLDSLQSGGTAKGVSQKYLSILEISLPNELKEQELISHIFLNLDRLISLHQRKLEMLKKVKKSMLEKMFPKNDAKVPELRFSDFTDAWEQCKVNSLFEPLTERNDDLLPYSKTLSVATMTYKEVGNGAADSSLANYKRLRLGDVAFEGHTSKEFRYGRFVLNDAGDGIMSPRFSALRPISELPVQFWKYYIHYEPIMKRSLVNCTKAGTMMNELVVPEFLQESLLVPSTDEQVQIGKYFANLNHLIILHQRKLEKLKNIKKSMLEKMFII